MRGKGTRIAAVAAGLTAVGAIVFGSAVAHEGGHRLPKPGGSPTAVVPIPAAGKLFGFNDPSFLNKRRFVHPAVVAFLARKAGAQVHRYEIAWKDVEPVRDRWNEEAWKGYQAIDRALAAEGIRSLVVLAGTPQWARERGNAAACGTEKGCEYPPSVDELDHWREYAAEVAKRLKNPIIETWNEPNLELFFKPSPNPTRYARMHVAAFKAIKRVRRGTPVLFGGTANVPDTAKVGGRVTRYSQREFLQRIYREVKGKFNGISTHPYPGHPTRRGRNDEISHAVHDVRTVQKRFNDRGNDIWITETGQSTTGPGKVSAGNQAVGSLASYRKLMTMADVKAMVIHTLFDQTDAPRSTRAHGFGLIRSANPLKVKPAYCAFNGRAGRGLIAGCTKKNDRRAPGARQARGFKKVCKGWLKPQRSYRKGRSSAQARKRDKCLIDLLTIESDKLGRVNRIRAKAATKAGKRPGAHKAARGRTGIKMARRAVKKLARKGYL